MWSSGAGMYDSLGPDLARAVRFVEPLLHSSGQDL